MRIILDIPFNHTSNQHPWFKDAVDNPNSRFRKFYHFADISQPSPSDKWRVAKGSSGKKVRYLGLFDSSMPDLNLNEPEVQKEIKEIAKFWLDNGIDGFRLDAAKHIFSDNFKDLPLEADILRNNDWWRAFSDFVYQKNPDAVLVGEVLGSQETLRRHAYGLDALLDEPLMDAARSRIAFPTSNFVTNWKNFVNSARDVNRMALQRPGSQRTEPFQSFVYLASHDKNPRLASDLEEQKGKGMKPSVDQAYRVGMYILTSFGKYPILYNGDEVMQRGFKWNGNKPTEAPPGDGSGIYDETLREPFPWLKNGDSPVIGDNDMQTSWSSFLPKFDKPNDGVSVEEQVAPQKMLDLIRGLTNLRTKHPGYANGELGDILTDTSDWLVFEKLSGQDRYLVLINSTDSGLDYNFNQGHFPRYIGSQLIFFSDGKLKEWKDESNANKHIQAKVFVPPYGFILLKQK